MTMTLQIRARTYTSCIHVYIYVYVYVYTCVCVHMWPLNPAPEPCLCGPALYPQVVDKYKQRSCKTAQWEMPLSGVQEFFEACFMASPSNLESVYNHLRQSDGEFPIWKFLRLLIHIVYPQCKHIQKLSFAQKRRQSRRISFMMAPQTPRAFRGTIPREEFDVSKLKKIKILGKGGNCITWLCKYTPSHLPTEGSSGSRVSVLTAHES